MNDYSELKRLAEAATPGPWQTELAYPIIQPGYLARGSIASALIWPDAHFIAAANPAAVLALIAENERLVMMRSIDAQTISRHQGQIAELIGEGVHLKAEVESLRKDKDRLDAIEANYWDVRHLSSPIADTGDSSTSVEIVGHWMDKPWERVIGENYNENLRAALDQAMTADAYPPARPEYPEFDDIPDFGGGSGNKARRRAEALGVDYDAAMSNEDAK